MNKTRPLLELLSIQWGWETYIQTRLQGSGTHGITGWTRPMWISLRGPQGATSRRLVVIAVPFTAA